MNPEFKAKWLEALRSGRYRQITNNLKRGGGYCCLGVLCDISDTYEWCDCGHVCYYGQCSQLLPREIKVAVELSDFGEDTLMNMNDRDGKNFFEIADWIEANL